MKFPLREVLEFTCSQTLLNNLTSISVVLATLIHVALDL